MTFSKVGFNPAGLENLTSPNVTLPTSGTKLLNNLPTIANSTSLGYFPHVILTGLFILFYWILSDKSPFGEFKYSDIRAFNLSSGLVALLGWTMLEINYIVSLRMASIFTIIFLLSHIYLIIMSNKE